MGGIDPLAGNYIDISPYAFVKNNPINNIEIDGRYFDEKNEKKADRILRQAEAKASKLEKKADRLTAKGKDAGDLCERATELRKSAQDIRDMKNDKTTEYQYGKVGSKEASNLNLIGPTTMAYGTNEKGDKVVKMFTESNMGNQLHETRHGGQNARSEYNIGSGTNYGVADEVSAYRTQYSWGGELQYRSNLDMLTKEVATQRILEKRDPTVELIKNINQITAAAVMIMVDPGNKSIYPGNIPLNIFMSN